MKITLKQHGGMAAAPGGRPLTLDTADLGERRDEVEGLARAVSGQPGATRAAHPDEMSYTLIIADADGTHEVHGMGSGRSAEFSRLMREVRSAGKAGTS